MVKEKTSYSCKMQLKVLAEVMRVYVLEVTYIRKLIFPFIILVVSSKFLEVFEIKFSSRLFSSFNSDSMKKEEQLIYLGIASFLYIITSFLFEFINFMFTSPIQRAFRKSSRETFSKYINIDYDRFNKLGSGEIHSSIERKSKAVSDILEVIILEIFPMIVSFIFNFCALAFKIGIFVPSIMAFTLVIFVYVTISVTTRRAELRKEVNKRINIQSNILYDTLINYETVLAYNNRNLEIMRYDEKLGNTEKFYSELYKAYFVLNLIQKLILNTQAFFVILIGIYGFNTKKFTNETFLFYSQSLKIIGTTLYKSGYLYNKYAMGIINYACSEREVNIVEESTTKLQSFNSSILFKNVSIICETGHILQNINFKINKCEKIAIVGRNGVGKSSLLKVILGFYKYKGEVYIDNNEYRSYSVDSIRDNIAYIHQDSAIFNDTIKYNIMYGNVNASDEKIISVCKRIEIHESIKRLPMGYMTIAGERGVFLSGGERQKIAFARAALKNADILILDEPTASLDKNAEKLILDKIMDYFYDRTVIMIVHNLKLLTMFDKIIFIEDKTVKEVGSFQNLIENNGSFFNYYKNFSV